MNAAKIKASYGDKSLGDFLKERFGVKLFAKKTDNFGKEAGSFLWNSGMRYDLITRTHKEVRGFCEAQGGILMFNQTNISHFGGEGIKHRSIENSAEFVNKMNPEIDALPKNSLEARFVMASMGLGYAWKVDNLESLKINMMPDRNMIQSALNNKEFGEFVCVVEQPLANLWSVRIIPGKYEWSPNELIGGRLDIIVAYKVGVAPGAQLLHR